MIMKKETKPSPFDGYTETVEKVQAFQFEEAHQINDVLDAFGADHGTWTISSVKGSLSLKFPRPQKGKAELEPVTLTDASGSYTWNAGTITIAHSEDSGKIVVHEGDWIVRRYLGTQHEETVVISDKDFKRKYR